MSRNSEFNLRQAASEAEANRQEGNKDKFKKDVFALHQRLAAEEYYTNLTNFQALTAKEAEKSQHQSSGQINSSLKPMPTITKDPKPVVNPTIVSGRKLADLEDLNPVTQGMIDAVLTANVVQGPLARQALINTFANADANINAATQTARAQVQQGTVQFESSPETNASAENSQASEPIEPIQAEASAEVQSEPEVKYASPVPTAPVPAPRPSSTATHENKDHSTNKSVMTVKEFGESSNEIEHLFALAAESDPNAQYALLTWYELKPKFTRLLNSHADQFSQRELDHMYDKGRSIVLRNTYTSLQFTAGPRQPGSIAGNIFSIFYPDNNGNVPQPQNAPGFNN